MREREREGRGQEKRVSFDFFGPHPKTNAVKCKFTKVAVLQLW